jgi:hypothetical protein
MDKNEFLKRNKEKRETKEMDKFKVVPCSCNDPECSGWQLLMKTSKKENK